MTDLRLPAAALAAIFVLIAPRPSFTRAADPRIEWRTDYNAARKESAETGLPLLLQIGTEECFYCKKMDATTFKDAKVIAMAGGFIPVKIDGNKEAALTKALKIQVYPTTVLAAADGTIHAFVQGHVGVDPFKEQLKRTTDLVAADRKPSQKPDAELVKLAAAAKKANEAAAELQLTLAEAYREKGDPAEAAKCCELAIRLAPDTPRAEKAHGLLAKLRALVPITPAVRQK
jgi:thioredoxin-like negative regulator of GroEL